MLGIFVDIGNEFEDIEAEVAMLDRALDTYARHPEWFADIEMRWLAVQGLASGVEKVYSGMERVMQRIANQIDGAAIDHQEGWHVTLLRRMRKPFGQIRPAVISEDTFRTLNDLRAFRHRERNSYGLSLDEDRVLERAAQTGRVFGAFRGEVTELARHMQAAADGNPPDP